MGDNIVELTINDGTNSATCKSIVKIVNALGIIGDSLEKDKSNYLKLYPDPASDELTIDMNMHDNGPIQLKITNIAGQMIYEQEFGKVKGIFKKNINIKDIATGIYFVKIITSNDIMNRKFVIER